MFICICISCIPLGFVDSLLISEVNVKKTQGWRETSENIPRTSSKPAISTHTSLVLLVSRMLSEPRKTREAPPCHPRRHGYQSIGPASHCETPDGGYATIPENGGIQRFISAVNVHRHGQRHGIRPKLFTAGPTLSQKAILVRKDPRKPAEKILLLVVHIGFEINFFLSST